MNPLGDAIDKAVKEQYPNGDKPTFLQTTVRRSDRDRWVDHFDLQLRSNGVVAQKEFRFHPERMWRFDRAFPDRKIAVEIDGGGFGRVVICNRCNQPVTRTTKEGRPYPIREGGRHNTGSGMEADHEKHNAAVVLGWRVLRFTPKHIRDKSGINLLIEVLKTVPPIQ